MPHYHRGGGSNIFSLTLMFSAFSFLFLYLTWLFLDAQLVFYAIGSFFIMGIMLEESFGAAFISFAAVSLLGFLILPDKTMMWPYVLFFGHYGIGKYLIEKRKQSVFTFVSKLVYFNAALVLLYFIAPAHLFAFLPFELPFAAFIVVMEGIFIAYDFLFSKISLFYDAKIRHHLSGSLF